MNSGDKVNKNITGRINHFHATGLTFSIGDEIKPSYQDVVLMLKHLYTGGYTERYRLVQTTIPHDLLFTGGSKDQYHALVPQIVRNAEWLVQTGSLDVYDEYNYRLIVAVYVLSWYWHHVLGGPKPAVGGLKETHIRKIIQNEPLQCPVCYKKYCPPPKLVTQEAKAWSFLGWLPTHFVEYHLWTPSSKFIPLVTKEALRSATARRAKI
ncbi:MAG: hypothetical protein LUQ68_04775, partial [Methylococcaceae bacterium]|nr:hypothetical protein [Methylococcaceae bacterium]